MSSFEQDPAGTPGTPDTRSGNTPGNTPGSNHRHTHFHAHLPVRLWRWLRDRPRPALFRPSLADLLVEVPLALALLSAVLLSSIAGPGG
jgi:hypothetical protein